MNELALFAGAGGGILGGHLLGWRCVCAVEWEPYPAGVLIARQNEGFLPPFPIWDDVRTFDGHPWRGLVDVVSGGFPCQDISSAGTGDGLDGERSGLWREMARIIGEIRPRFAFVENSPMLTLRGLNAVLGNLAALGYDAEWGVFGADDAGLDQKRERIWIVAHTRENRRDGRVLAENHGAQRKENDQNQRSPYWFKPEMGSEIAALCPQREDQPDPPPMVDDVADWVDQLEATGNGQVPAVVRLAWNVLYKRLNLKSI